MLLEKYIFIVIEKKVSNFNVCYNLDSDDSDEENSDEYINLFLEKKQEKYDKFIFLRNKKNVTISLSLGL